MIMNPCCHYYRCEREKPIVVVFATKDEVDEKFYTNPYCQVVITGVGKINASIFSLLKLLKRKTMPVLLLNLGTCGSFTFPQGTIVQCFTLYQYDMNATQAGFPLGLTPYETYININVYDKKLDITKNPKENVIPGILFCGDVFVTKESYVYTTPVIVNGISANDTTEPLIFSFEGYELGKISKLLNLPYACVKIVSDNGNVTDYLEYLKIARPKLYSIYKIFQSIVIKNRTIESICHIHHFPQW